MLELAIALPQLIDRIIQFAKRREEVDRNTYSDFVAPVMASVDDIHKDYIESFKRYETILADTSSPLDNQHPIFAAIERDNLFSENLRAKITELDVSALTKRNAALGDLLLVIWGYLYGNIAPDIVGNYSIEPKLQYTRTSLAQDLREWIDEREPEMAWRREGASFAVRKHLADMQNRYRLVLSKHEAIKHDLLKPH